MPGRCDPKPGVQAVDVWLQNPRPPGKSINAVFGCGTGLVHVDVLDLIGEDIVKRDLYLGRVFGGGDKQLPDWRTYRGRRGVIIRGDKEAANRVCDQCGRNCYFAMGKSYLYPAPPSDATIFESSALGLVVPPEVFDARVSQEMAKHGKSETAGAGRTAGWIWRARFLTTRIARRGLIQSQAHFAGQFRCSCKNSNVPTPWIVCGPSKNSIVGALGDFQVGVQQPDLGVFVGDPFVGRRRRRDGRARP